MVVGFAQPSLKKRSKSAAANVPVPPLTRYFNVKAVDAATPVFVTCRTTLAATESVVITDCGTKLNGTHTVTATYPWSQGSGTFPFFRSVEGVT